jgi:hypothetical protein
VAGKRLRRPSGRSERSRGHGRRRSPVTDGALADAWAQPSLVLLGVTATVPPRRGRGDPIRAAVVGADLGSRRPVAARLRLTRRGLPFHSGGDATCAGDHGGD